METLFTYSRSFIGVKHGKPIYSKCPSCGAPLDSEKSMCSPWNARIAVGQSSCLRHCGNQAGEPVRCHSPRERRQTGWSCPHLQQDYRSQPWERHVQSQVDGRYPWRRASCKSNDPEQFKSRIRCPPCPSQCTSPQSAWEAALVFQPPSALWFSYPF